MCRDIPRELLTQPVAAIARAKKTKDINKTLVLLVVEWVIIGLGILVAFRELTKVVALSFFATLLGIICTLFSGLFTQIVFDTLGGKGKYYEGLTASVYAKFPISIGIFCASVISAVSIAAIIPAFIVMMIFVLLGLSTFYRAVKELFTVDTITAWVGMSILFLAVFVSFYLTLVFSIGTVRTFMPMIS
jgi:hypothetical protein